MTVALAFVREEPLPQPAYVHLVDRPFADKCISVHCLGKARTGALVTGSWRLDAERWRTNDRTCREVVGIVTDHGADALYYCNAMNFSRRVIPAEERNGHFLGSRTYADLTVHWSADTDGGQIRPRESLGLWSADCATVVAYQPETGILVAAHAGRNCLFAKDGTAYPDGSVIDRLLALFPGDRSAVMVKVYLAISTYNFPHPVKDHPLAEHNLRMLRNVQKHCPRGVFPERGRLSLVGVIRDQCMQNGVDGSNVRFDGSCPYESPDFHSYRRDSRGPKGDQGGRNGILVVYGR
jgi:copper oxidase (laccase) domain-containing protein